MNHIGHGPSKLLRSNAANVFCVVRRINPSYAVQLARQLADLHLMLLTRAQLLTRDGLQLFSIKKGCHLDLLMEPWWVVMVVVESETPKGRILNHFFGSPYLFS